MLQDSPVNVGMPSQTSRRVFWDHQGWNACRTQWHFNKCGSNSLWGFTLWICCFAEIIFQKVTPFLVSLAKKT